MFLTKAERAKAWRQANADRVKAYREANKDRRYAQTRAWNAANRDRKNELHREWSRRNPEKVQEKFAGWHAENSDRVRDQQRRYRADNPGKMNALSAKKRAAKRRATPAWLTDEHKRQIEAFYIAARHLTVETGVEHHVDHIDPLASDDACGLHVPWNLQILTAAENIKKGNRRVGGNAIVPQAAAEVIAAFMDVYGVPALQSMGEAA